jgi:uncharacterized protein (TIGR02611 family)
MTQNLTMPIVSPRRITRRRQVARWFEAHRVRYPWLDPLVKIVVALVGVLLILAGLAMMLTPGPGWLTVFAGLAVLATEFRWARHLARAGETLAHRLSRRFTGQRMKRIYRLKKRWMGDKRDQQATSGATPSA